MITGIYDEFWEEFFNDVKNNNVPTDTYKEFKGIVTDYLCEKLRDGCPLMDIGVWIAVPISEFKENLEKTSWQSQKYWKLYEGGLTPKWLYKEGYIIERYQYTADGIGNVFNTSLMDFMKTLNRIHLDCKEHYFMGFAEPGNPIGQVYEYFFECNPNLFDEMLSALQPTKLTEMDTTTKKEAKHYNTLEELTERHKEIYCILSSLAKQVGNCQFCVFPMDDPNFTEVEDGTLFISVGGGHNGGSAVGGFKENWEEYFDTLSKFVRMASDSGLRLWMVNASNDCLDDMFTVQFGVREQ